MQAECLACGSPKLFRANRCDWCYRFWLKHGQDRTFDELRPALERRLVREQEVQVIRAVLGA